MLGGGAPSTDDPTHGLTQKAETLRAFIVEHKRCLEEGGEGQTAACERKEQQAELFIKDSIIPYLRNPSMQEGIRDHPEDAFALLRMTMLAYKETSCGWCSAARAELLARVFPQLPFLATGCGRQQWAVARDFVCCIARDVGGTDAGTGLLQVVATFLGCCVELLVGGWAGDGDGGDSPARICFAPSALAADSAPAPVVVLRSWADVYACATAAAGCAVRLLPLCPPGCGAEAVVTSCVVLGRVRTAVDCGTCAAAIAAAVRRLPPSCDQRAPERAAAFALHLVCAVPAQPPAYTVAGFSTDGGAPVDAAAAVPLLTTLSEHLSGAAAVAAQGWDLLRAATASVADSGSEELREAFAPLAAAAGTHSPAAGAAVCVALLASDERAGGRCAEALLQQLAVGVLRPFVPQSPARKRPRTEAAETAELPPEERLVGAAAAAAMRRDSAAAAVLRAMAALCFRSEAPGPLSRVAAVVAELGADGAGVVAARVVEAALRAGCPPTEAVRGLAVVCGRRHGAAAPLARQQQRTAAEALLSKASALLNAPVDAATAELVCGAVADMRSHNHQRLSLCVDLACSAQCTAAAAALRSLGAVLRGMRLGAADVARVVEGLQQAAKLPDRHLHLFRAIPEVLPELYCPRGDAAMDIDDDGGADAAATDAAAATADAGFPLRQWLAMLSSLNGRSPDVERLAAEVGALAAVVRAGGAEDPGSHVSMLQSALLRGPHGGGLITHESEQVRTAARELAAAAVANSLSGGSVLSAVLPPTGRGGSVGAYTAHLSSVARLERISSDAAASISAVLRTAATLAFGACEGADPSADGPLHSTLLAVLKLLVPSGAAGAAAMSYSARAVLIRAERERDVSVQSLLQRHPDPELFKLLFDEMPTYTQTRRPETVPALFALSNFMDAEVEVFVLQVAPALLPWAVRCGGTALEYVTRLGRCLECLDDGRVEAVFRPHGRKVFKDRHAMLASLLMHFFPPVLAGILIDTPGDSWEEYFLAARRHLEFVEKHSREYASALSTRCGSVAQEVVLWAGREDNVEGGRRALALLGLAGAAAAGSRESRGGSAVPAKKQAKWPEGERAACAADVLADDVFYQTFDGFTPGSMTSDAARLDIGNVLVGVRRLRVLVQLLAPERDSGRWEKYATKIQPVLQTWTRVAERFGSAAARERVCSLLRSTWLCYIQALPPACVHQQLPELVVKVMELSRLWPHDAASLLTELHGRSMSGSTPEDRVVRGQRWQEVLNIVPRAPDGPFAAFVALVGPPQRQTLKEQLQSVHKGLQTPSREYRRASLSALYHTLRQHRNDVRRICADSAAGEPPTGAKDLAAVLQRLLEMLARDRAHETDVFGWIMTCVGVIGAMSPGQMRRLRPAEKQRRLRHSNDDESFAVALLDRYIVKAVQGPRQGSADTAAYAAQELFKHLLERGRRELGGDGRGSSHADKVSEARRSTWWSKMSRESRRKLEPFLITRYKLDVVVKRDQKALEYERGMDFRTWLRALTVGMIGRAQGDRGRMMQVVRNVVKGDVDMGIFMLPYVVENIAVHGAAADRDCLVNEFTAIFTEESESPGTATEHVQVLCGVLDKLTASRDDLRAAIDEHRRRHPKAAVGAQDKARLEALDRLLGDLSGTLPVIVKACRAHNPARALRYMEQYLRSVRPKTDGASAGTATQATQGLVRRWCNARDVRLYQDTYARLYEPDGLAGVASLRQSQAFAEELSHQAVDLETVGLWTEATRRYELLIERYPKELAHQQRLLQCLQHVGQYTVVLAFAEGRPPLRDYVLQAAWRLGEWDTVRATLLDAGDPGAAVGFEAGVARALLSVHQGDFDSVPAVLARARDGLHSEIAAASLESYEAAYPHLVKLHALEDIECAAAVVRGMPGSSPEQSEAAKTALLAELRERALATQGAAQGLETLLAVRRAIACLLHRDKDVARTWLEWGKLCRKRGLYEVANAALLRAEAAEPRNRPEGLTLQQAKLLWARGDKTEALRVVSEVPVVGQPREAAADAFQLRLCALYWAQELRQRSYSEITQEYEDVLRQQPTSDKASFRFAQYLDKQLDDYMLRHGPASAHEDKAGDYAVVCRDKVPLILTHYCNALVRGNKHLYHALPRVLGVYFDTVGTLAEKTKRERPGGVERRAAESSAKLINDKMMQVVSALPAHALYTGLHQIISRIGHPSADVLAVVGLAVRRVMQQFPDRAVWALVGVMLSKQHGGRRADNMERYVNRKMREDPRRHEAALKAIDQCLAATECINQLAELPVAQGEKELSYSTLDCAKRFKGRLPLSITVPSQQQLSLLHPLPASGSFFSPLATFHGIDNDVKVMNSLQKPKRVTVRTGTGLQQPFLCKAKDELRKDARVMELVHILNLLLAKRAETRQRQLRMKTFAVTLTGDESGMIEWVTGVETFRLVCDRLYLKSPHGLPHDKISRIHKDVVGRQLSAVDAYTRHILPHFPPILHRFFVSEFPDPIAWFTARNAFTRSCAVWSMLGHILGMGDRHGENILLDTNTGEVMHVDFAILFDKGLSLEVPEVVRFRLTPNMVDSMGIKGYEGVFRKCAELSMDVMRVHKDTVMGVLNLFLHDPLIDWAPRDSHRRAPGIDDWKPQALSQLSQIRRRLDGHFDDPVEQVRRIRRERLTGSAGGPSRDGVAPLNVQGQVQKLIDNATSEENLSNMYIWWMAWL